ncbi:hypothetical protein [Agrilutibacter solisilvae]|uniref:Tetratricopeptide repeat protein n=1 Tax=Agrilutibacter solisilvae TaxID=2763317 RepID=A0A975ARX5_9GAMM|nr:hypothetical protein [Lysobacter solisilvae]QSX77484.1 hypothetical protein I8J32_012055 [Lysobacter solisilvae]
MTSEQQARAPSSSTPPLSGASSAVAVESGAKLRDRPIDPRFAACEAQHHAAVQRRAQELSASQKAEDLVSSVVLSQSLNSDFLLGKTRPEYLQALATATRLGPDNELGAWMYAVYCRNDKRCDASAAVARLIALEPNNLAPRLLAIDVAERGSDKRRARALLRQASVTRYVDFRMGDFAQRQVSALSPLPQMPACGAASAAIAEHYQLTRPGTVRDVVLMNAKRTALFWFLAQQNELLEMCPHDRLWTPDDGCRHAFEILATSDMWIPRQMALMVLSTNARTTAERDRWRAQQRELDWLSHAGGPLRDSIPFDVIWEQGEIAPVIALLRSQGRWPAPQDWQPPAEGQP